MWLFTNIMCKFILAILTGVGLNPVSGNHNTYCNFGYPYEDREECEEDACWGFWGENEASFERDPCTDATDCDVYSSSIVEGLYFWYDTCDNCNGCKQGSLCRDLDRNIRLEGDCSPTEMWTGDKVWGSWSLSKFAPLCCELWDVFIGTFASINKNMVCDDTSKYDQGEWVGMDMCCVCTPEGGYTRSCMFHDDVPNNGLEGCDWDDYVGCVRDYAEEGSASCDAAMAAGFMCGQLEKEYLWDCAGCNCAADPYWVDYTYGLAYRAAACSATGNDSWCISNEMEYEFDDMTQNWTGSSSGLGLGFTAIVLTLMASFVGRS